MEVAAKAPLASESSHWYHRDGRPCYEVPAKSKAGMRATTIRDAREMDLVPSVTTIIRCAAAPGLERWKSEQLLLAALTLPKIEGETESDWRARVNLDAKEQARKAADRGTEIHAAIESYYRGEVGAEGDKHLDLWPWVDQATLAVTNWVGRQTWSPEKSFAHPLGFGGKVDLHSASVLVDFKTKDGIKDVRLYDEHLMQLAAYMAGVGLKDGRAAIVFVDRLSPKATILEASPEELHRGWRMFRSLLDYWYAANDLRREVA